MLPIKLLLLATCVCAATSERQRRRPGDEMAGKSSLTFVFDITGSMFDDLVQVREGARKIFQTVMQQREKLIYNYIMVPFHDPYLGEVINTTDAAYFMRQLNKVYVHGGGDCPEKTLTGIQKALELSLPSSFIYVFTDARSKDYELEDIVLNMIQEKQSSVVFVMTGDCGNRTHPGFRVYEKIAAASFGQVFHLEKSDVSTVLEYVRHAVKQKKVHILYEVRERGGTVIRNVPVDKHMTELTLSLSGDKDDEDILDITLKDPSGRSVDKNIYSKEGGNIDLKNVKLIRLKDPKPGIWQVITKSRLKHTIRIFGHGTIDFKYGFGTRLLERIELAHPRPVSNQNTYLMVNMTGLIPPGSASEIGLMDYYGNVLYSNVATTHVGNPHMFFAGPFVPPKGLFFVRVKGVDEDKYEYQRIAPTAIGSVDVGGPRAYMSPTTTAFVNMDANLTCMIESASPFTLYWKKDDQHIGGPFFYQITDTARWTLPEVTHRDRGEYYCIVVSSNGNHTVKTYLDVQESPPLLISPTEISTPIGNPTFLHCQSQSSSKVEIRWLRHGVSIPNNFNNLVYPNGTLRIHQTSQADAGAYECQARNLGGMTSQTIQLKVLELPKASISPSILYFVPHTSFNLSCYVDGDPRPQPYWFYNGREIQPDHKYYITFKNDLIVRDPSPNDFGVYECRAVSAAGSHSDSATVYLGAMPSIVPSPETVRVNIERQATLQCRAVGHPSPAISWQRDGVPLEIVGNSRYTVLPDGNLLITNAQVEDQTRFTCIAKNEFGQQAKTIMVMITGLVSPVLGHVPPEEQLIEGEDLHLSCVVVLGTPKPDIIWFKDGVPLESSSSVIIEGGGSSLLLRNGNSANEGKYTCAAISPAGNATLNVNVQLIKKPEFVLDERAESAELSIREGQSMELPCRVRGTPTPAVTWSLDGRPISINSKDYTITQENSLIIINADKSSAGTYTCTAMNPAGENEQSTYVSVIAAPVISPGQSSFNLIHGTSVTIPCDVYMEPMPEIKWYLNGEPFEDGYVDENGALTIDNVEEIHRGQLKCVASNDAGEDERVVTLTVHTAPIIDGSGQASTISKIVLVNETVSLPCPAHAIPPPIRIWSYEGQNLEETYMLYEHEVDGELILPSVQLDNTGHYTCLVSNLAGDDSITYSLEVTLSFSYGNKVHEKPKIVSETPSTIDVILGLTLEIPCKARGTPEPERIWKKDGIQIRDDVLDTVNVDSAGTLRIMNTQTSHSGQYTCEVGNAVGTASQVTTVVVQEPPVILPATMSNYTSVEGDLVEIRCYVKASPPAVIQWLRKGVPIHDSIPGVSVDGGTLVIESVSKDDAAFYTCQVSNPAGKAEKVIRLSVIVPPNIPDQDRVSLESIRIHQPFSLYCPVISTPLPKAHTTSAGVYKCVAHNLAGESSKTFDVEVIVPLNIDESEWKRKVSVFEKSRIELGCPVSGHPDPSVNWIVGGRILNPGDKVRGIKLSESGNLVCR
ncbi:unnamed protein product [Angiostrongylus costaricensis]|uniref:Hemicentin-1 n=1 Tax=Angiostrongylus costaricensis TaxID=334426 RepID=A0A158PJ75_ANGCS|nr:unnamed protein product [Angiostrongylus costaricensis]